MKKGDIATMLFHCAGVTTKEQWPVLKVLKSKNIVILHTDEYEEKECYKFDMTTGECLNDNTDFGCKRTLKIT